MTEDELTIQCENCGTLYSELEEACPYCGEPPLYDDEPLPDEMIDPVVEEDEAYADYPLEEEAEEDPFADEDIFAVVDWPEEALAEEETPYDYEEPYAPPYEEAEEIEAEAGLTWRRWSLGCLGILLCIGLFYGGVGLLGVYHGLQERTQLTQGEVETHYQKGQEYLAEGSLELAIAEFQLALRLNPNHLPAREALREARSQAQAQPSPTSQTRLAAAVSLFEEAQAQVEAENWAEAVENLAKVRELDPDYRAEPVSDLLYQANYRLSQELLSPDQVEEVVLALESALSERPDDVQVSADLAKALLYIEGRENEGLDNRKAAEVFQQLYEEDPTYLDTADRLLDSRLALAEELVTLEEWCQAEIQYTEAHLLQPDEALQAKIATNHERCQELPVAAQATRPPTATPRTAPAQATPGSETAAAFETTETITGTPAATQTTPAVPGSGHIIYSAYNVNETRWEIVSIPAGGGTPKTLVVEGTMPALSPNGQYLLYRSELIDSEGFHLFDLTTGQDQRITRLKRHILPRWGGNNKEYVFVAQEPTTGRWQVHLGFADGKSDPLIIRDGRSADWSTNQRWLAYQGTDPEGNNPGIYLVPFDGGESTRLTNHESDRTPVFSPDGQQLAYMSTRSGNWDIYTISAEGSAPRRVTASAGNDGLPAWSPDGSQIAYVSDADGSWAIYRTNADGSGSPTRVIPWDGSNRADWLLSQIWWGR